MIITTGVLGSFISEPKNLKLSEIYIYAYTKASKGVIHFELNWTVYYTE